MLSAEGSVGRRVISVTGRGASLGTGAALGFSGAVETIGGDGSFSADDRDFWGWDRDVRMRLDEMLIIRIGRCNTTVLS